MQNLVFLLLFIGMTALHSQELNQWQFKSSSDTIWRSFHFPGNCFTALLDQGMIDHPFWGTNETKLQWVGLKDWEFKAIYTADLSVMNSNHIELVLDRIDTYADIYWNGNLLASTENAFRTYTLDIKKYMLEGKNELYIYIHSADKISADRYSKLKTKLPGEQRVTTRKPQYHFGWDFGPKLISSGLNGTIHVVSYSSLRLDETFIATKNITGRNAELELFCLVQSDQQQDVSFDLFLNQQKFSFVSSVKKGRNELKLPFAFTDAKLWWPNGSGDPYLYHSQLELKTEGIIQAKKTWKTGIRTIELVHEADSFGKSFYFKVNGVSIFAKGANYIPHHIFQTYSPNDSTISYLINDAKICHFNMLRVWGGGNYESDRFYQLCDEAGIMIWQDFMFACGMYPGSQSFLTEIAKESEDQVLRLSKHACIALWCGNNENNEGWHRWGWQLTLLPKARKRLWRDYEEVFHKILPLTVQHYSNSNSYWASSPLYGRGDSKFKTEGDAHDWGVWHDEMPFSSFKERIPRFMSEAGFQSLPQWSTIQSIASENEMDLQSEALLSHQKHPRGNKLIQTYIERDFPKAKGFKSLIYLNQLTQAEGIGMAIQAHRTSKPYCMGTLYWQYNDCWPGISWSSRDFYGTWKALQYYTRRLYKPTQYFLELKENAVELISCSEESEIKSKILNWKLEQMNGTLLAQDSIKISSQNDKAIRHTLINDIKKISGVEAENCLLSVWDGEEIVSTLFFEEYKKLRLKKTKVNMILTPIEKDTVTSSDRTISLAYHYLLELNSSFFVKAFSIAESRSLVIEDNFFDLFANRPKRIVLHSDSADLKVEDLEILSLNDLMD
ncbi:MAG TPA: hypothetical protein PK006_09460 [Saprospiraceae bacterium]|nr:hypothetical protein [Saprospiraceae bacterium]